MTGLAVEAAQKALEMAEVKPDDVDLILLCTSTPEDLFGGAPQVQSFSFFKYLNLIIFFVLPFLFISIIFQIQKALGCKGNPLAFDITAACSGFVLGLVSASCYIRGIKIVFFFGSNRFLFP